MAPLAMKGGWVVKRWGGKTERLVNRTPVPFAVVHRHIIYLICMSGRSIIRQMLFGPSVAPARYAAHRDRTSSYRRTISFKLELLASPFNFVHRRPTVMLPNEVFVGFKRTLRNILKMGRMNTKRLE